MLNNFEIVATTVIALGVFRKKIGVRLWFGILLVTLPCSLLSFEDVSGLRSSIGSLLILFACICWERENNCTRKISSKDLLQIVLLKGIFLRRGGACHRVACRGMHIRSLECFCRSGRRICRLRTECFFLSAVCAENSRRRPHKLVLCHSSFYWNIFILADFQGNAAVYLIL